MEQHTIDQDKITNYPALKPYAGCVINTPTYQATITPKHVETIAKKLSKAYEAIEDSLAEDEELSEHQEELLGTSLSQYITELAYMAGLTKEV